MNTSIDKSYINNWLDYKLDKQIERDKNCLNLDQQMKSYMNRLKVRSTNQKLHQQIKDWINRSKVRSSDQKLDQRMKS